jgi:hypothetical protein
MVSQEPTKKSHHYQGPPKNTRRAKERSEMYFLVYEALGVTRSLKRLWGLLRGAGVTISLKRLEQYSQEFGWQAKLLERAARGESTELQNIKLQVEKMNNDHVQMFRDLGILAQAGISFYKAKIDAQNKAGLNNTLEMTITDLSKLAEAAQRGERLAMGLATSKADVLVEVLPPLVKDIYAVFIAVNVITKDDPATVRRREAEFIERSDQVLIQHYGTGNKTGLTTN